jgi:hypothetical protein
VGVGEGGGGGGCRGRVRSECGAAAGAGALSFRPPSPLPLPPRAPPRPDVTCPRCLAGACDLDTGLCATCAPGWAMAAGKCAACDQGYHASGTSCIVGGSQFMGCVCGGGGVQSNHASRV